MSKATIQNNNLCIEVVDIDQSTLQNNTRGNRKWETFIGFTSTETLQLLPWCAKISLKVCSYADGQGISCLWKLNVQYHIHKSFSIILLSNQAKIHLNTIIPAILTSLNWPFLEGFWPNFVYISRNSLSSINYTSNQRQ